MYIVAAGPSFVTIATCQAEKSPIEMQNLVRRSCLASPLRRFLGSRAHGFSSTATSKSAMPSLMHPALPLVAFGAGVWLSSDPERPARVRTHMEAAVRAARLLGTCVVIAREYRAARAWTPDDEGEDVRLLAVEHLRFQQLAGRAEAARAKAQAAGGAELQEAAAEARRTREHAMGLGEELASLRLKRADEIGIASRWEELHERCAVRLKALCIANGGVYVKLGQHMAQLDYLVPKPYTRNLRALFEHNAPSSADQVIGLIEQEMGRSLSDCFDDFDATPIASASLAQVHRAVERGTGRQLAVKVQHPRLAEASASDMAAVALAVRIAEWIFPEDFRLGWIVDELAPHLPLELDFVHEAGNLERCRAFVASANLGDRVALPDVLPHLSSRRVLTMSFEEGTSCTNREAIESMGVTPAAVTRLMSETFCALIFDGGFVHCDPHPGNVLVRPRPDCPSEPQLVLLDHGLYRELPRRFVRMYADLWGAIVLGDADGIRRVSLELGVGEYYPLLAAMLTNRPWGDVVGSDSSSRLKERNTAADRAQIRGYAQQYLKQIMTVLERVPPPMLLLFKTNDCLRHAERQLDAGVDSFLITLRYSLQTILREDASRATVGERAHRMSRVRTRLHRVRLFLAYWLLRACTEGSLAARAARLLVTGASISSKPYVGNRLGIRDLEAKAG